MNFNNYTNTLIPPFSKARATRAQRDQTLARPRGASARARPVQRVTRLGSISFVGKNGQDGYCIVNNNESLDARRENAAVIIVFYLFGLFMTSGPRHGGQSPNV